MREKGDMQHPDEGTIHAWLDGALSAAEARAFEAHVAECAGCAAAVTEARGLLAASSRILSALDSVPGGVLPATEPEAGNDSRVIPIGRSSLWRSPGLRAAAAIVLVGSVSWLATRSVGREAEGNLAASPEVSSVAIHDSTTEASARVQADTVASVAERSAPPSAPRIAQSPARQARGRTESSGNADKPVIAPAPAQRVVAAPQAMPYAMPKLTESPNAGAAGGAAGKTAMTAQSTAPAAQAAPEGAGASTMQREERRVADAELSLRGSAKVTPRMKASAPSAAIGALAGMDAARGLDTEAERLAGCYFIETAPPAGSDPAIRSSIALLPERVELAIALDASSGQGRRVLRAAPGLPPIAAGTRATWAVLAADSVHLELVNGRSAVSARIAVTGDSLRGRAMITTPFVEGFSVVAEVRGRRMTCSAP